MLQGVQNNLVLGGWGVLNRTALCGANGRGIRPKPQRDIARYAAIPWACEAAPATGVSH